KMHQQGSASFWLKITKRAVLIFLIGLFLNWWPFFDWKDGSLGFREWVDSSNPMYGVRILGVLQRIALAYFFASIIAYYFRPKAIIWISTSLLFAYWGLCYFCSPGDPYSLAGYFGNAIDI